MSDMVSVAIIAAIPATLGAMLGYFNGRKLTVVHEAVNGGLQAAKDDLKAALVEITRLKVVIAEHHTTRRRPRPR